MRIKKIMFCALLAGLMCVMPGEHHLETLVLAGKEPVVIVIDAGHGGPDGGAESVDGTEEADLNLAIAQCLQKEAEKRGYKTVMTRTTEEGLYKEDNLQQQWRKLEDLACRRERIDEICPTIAISIHMNSFYSDTSVRGAQVFYPKTGSKEILDTSEKLAHEIQGKLIERLQDGSNRIEMAKENVYLLENPTVPTVLIECGFLSNPQDLGNLKQTQYQRKISQGILDGIEESEI